MTFQASHFNFKEFIISIPNFQSSAHVHQEAKNTISLIMYSLVNYKAQEASNSWQVSYTNTLHSPSCIT